MPTKRNTAILITLFSGLVLTGLFIWPNQSKAALILPQTPCDGQQEHAAVFGVEQPPAGGDSSVLEDGTRAFSYGNDNDFVSREGDVFTFNVVLKFESVKQPNAGVIMLRAFNGGCNMVLGLAPAFNNINLLELNKLVFDLSTAKTTLNGVTLTSRPRIGIKYLWIEVWDGNEPSNFASYSYLVDIDNIQNPTGIVDEPEAEPEGKRPVLIIPGIMGSELYDGEELIWPNINKLLASLSDNFLSESLAMDEKGDSLNDVAVGEIIERFPTKDIFKTLLDELGETLSEDNLHLFSYDWRLDLSSRTIFLESKIQQILNQTGFEKVDIIAHSMGGLLVKDYINGFGSERINKLIFVGTPHLGAPKAVNGLLTGDIGIPLNIVNEDAVEEISQNSASIYQLLPNQKYFDIFQEYLKPMPGDDVLGYERSNEFLEKVGKNSLLLARAHDFHDKHLEETGFGDIDVYNIAGCKKSTQAFYNVDATTGNVFNIKYTNGDGTVPFISADYIPSAKKYYVKNGNHAELPSLAGVRDLIVAILNDEQHSAANISTNTSFCNLRGKKLTWRSPVEIHIYDSNNNHAGPIENGFENNIPGVSYDIIAGEKFIFLPTDDNQEYRIEGTGTDTGTFDLLITDVENELEGNTELFDNIQIIPGSSVSFTVNDISDDSQINFDFDDTAEPVTLSASSFTSEAEAFEEAITDPVPSQEIEPVIEEDPEVPQTSPGGVGGLPALPIEDVEEDTKNENNGIILGEAMVSIPNGTLILDLSDGKTIYIIFDGKRYGFTSEQAFLERGFRFTKVTIGYVYEYELGGLIK